MGGALLRQIAVQAMALFCIVAAMLCFGASAAAASFSCEKAKTAVEKLVCADSELGELDARLAKFYAKTQASTSDLGQVTAAQRNWLKTVRDPCSTAACLQSAYHARIKQLGRNFVSFDCGQAKTQAEQLICGDDSLQYYDMQLAQTYRTLKSALGQQQQLKALIASQKQWLEQVRDPCGEVGCLRSAISQRTDVLRQQREDLLEGARQKIGYTKHAFYSDMMLWPRNPNRAIVVFATQASAVQGADGYSQPNEDFDVDLYVIDSKSYRVLQHGTDKVSSDAIELTGLTLDRADYAARLGAPAFGIVTSHYHRGCAGFSGSEIRWYVADGKGIEAILPEFETTSSSSMCGSDCESQSTRRDVQFATPTGQHYPDLLIREQTQQAVDDPKGPQGACKLETSKKEYRLHFDGVRYLYPGSVGGG